MRKLLTVICLLTLSWLRPEGVRADSYFPYPIVPDSVETFQGRCNYLAGHFWDFCDLSKAFSSRQKMIQEMRVYLTVIANASPDKAIDGITTLMKKLDKQPKDQLLMAEVAEGRLYGDTAQVWIDELYLPVAKAIAANKRISKAEKARYAQQAKVLEASMVGNPMPPVPMVMRDGSKGVWTPGDSTEVTVVFFYDPDCSDCSLTRVRLDADISMTRLIDRRLVKVAAIAVAEPDEEWLQGSKAFPATWTVGAAPDIDLDIDLRTGTPDIYLLGRRGTIRYKHLGADQVIDVARQLTLRTENSK